MAYALLFLFYALCAVALSIYVGALVYAALRLRP